jgi:hypothetical protein
MKSLQSYGIKKLPELKDKTLAEIVDMCTMGTYGSLGGRRGLNFSRRSRQSD